MKVRESKKNEPANGNKKIVFGMKAAMIVATIVPVLLALSIVGSILLLQVNGITDGLKKTEIDAQTKAASIQVDEYFAPYFVTAKVVADMDCVRDILEQADRAGAGFRFENSAYYREVMAEVSDVASNLDSGLLAVWYCGIANSELVSSDGSCSDASFVATERPWYKMVAANPGEVILTGAYEDYNSGVTVVTAAVGVYENGTDGLIGAIGMDIKIDALAEELGSISIGDAGYLTVYDSDNNIVYHRDSSRLLTALTDMNYSNNIYTALSGRTAASAMEYEEDGVSYCGSVILSSTTGWQILGCLPDAEFAQTSAAVRSTVNFTFGTCAVLIALIIIFIANGTINPIKRLNGVVTQLAEGDLDVDVKSKDKAEVKQLYENVGRLVDRLKTYILYIDEVSGVLDEIGHGNLVFHLEQDYVGEFDRLKVAMNEIQRNLSHTMYRIADSAAQVDSSTEQIASASQALAQGATEQASTVEQLSAAVHELSQHSVEESDRAVNLSKGVAVLGDELGRSNVQMQHMLGAMEEITTTSAEIEKIIKTIEDIAFQTNILALNAAVEAARAGTAGKGFAVVADEVRNLAAKSAEAAKSITVLIHSSLEAVDKGSGLASETAESMGKVAKDVTEVVTAVEQFAARYQEQTASLGQITEGIEQITAVIQTNSATAEESAASSEELSGQAHLMKQLTDQFTMDERFH